jgi:pimeloyl-ACP methyl ester carboxylesterase
MTAIELELKNSSPIKLTVIKAALTALGVMALSLTFLLSFAVQAQAVLMQDDSYNGATFERCFARGIERAAKCKQVEVPLNWDKPNGQKISINMAIIPAKGGFAEADPFILFAGGPGQAATDLSGLIKIAFDKINETRDIILIDQRGTGGSHKLHCDFDVATVELGLGQIDFETMEDMMRACAVEHEKTVDIRYFTTFDALKDVEHIRKLLGIEQFNIWGGSYGTRIGLLYMKLYPNSIRTAILDGVTSPNSKLFEITTLGAQMAFTALADDCAADAACYKAFGNINATFEGLLKKYRDNPEPMEVLNPITGEWEKGIMNERLLADIVRNTLYQPARASVLPFALSEAAKGNFKTLFALVIESSVSTQDLISPGLMLSVLCSEDMPRHQEAEAIAAGKDSFHKDFFYKHFKAGCAGWKIRDVIEGYSDPITVDIPTLVLSGVLDPITPPFSADYAVKNLPNVLHLTAAKVGHGVSFFGCAPDIMDDFVDSGSLADLDGACLNKPIRPAFLIRAVGTKP